jgi:hypothetical protein
MRLPASRSRYQRIEVLSVAEEHFAAADELVVDPDAVLIADGFRPGAGRTGLQAHSRRSLKNIGAERAAVGIEFNAEVAGFAEPGNLIAGIEDDGFWKNPNINGAVSHGESLPSTV